MVLQKELRVLYPELSGEERERREERRRRRETRGLAWVFETPKIRCGLGGSIYVGSGDLNSRSQANMASSFITEPSPNLNFESPPPVLGVDFGSLSILGNILPLSQNPQCWSV